MEQLPIFARAAAEEYFKSKLVTGVAHGASSFSNTARLEFENGKRAFLKYSEELGPGSYSAEAAGLRELRKQDAILVPEVLIVEDREDCLIRFLLLEFFDVVRPSAAAEVALGRNLASLHRATTERFGLESDNFIGANPQRNGWLPSWAEFFIERRLRPQFEMGEGRGWLDRSKRELFRSATEVVRDLLADHRPSPSLLHGDLWGGNVLWCVAGPVLIDPACYYGDRECDLAFTEMFGGFSTDFYRSYHEAWPLPDGYFARKVIYNWYHLLNHANLFGGGYISESVSVAKDICASSRRKSL